MLKTILFFSVIIVAALILILMTNSSNNTQTSFTPSPTEEISLVNQRSTTPQASQSAQIENPTSATITTSKGDITIEFYTADAPKTVENFVKKSQSGFYNGLTFHRVEDWVLQGGDPSGNGTGGGSMPVEFNSKPFVIGAVGVASRGDGKVQNDAQFFIVKKDSNFLDGKYTNFGMVTAGMDAVQNIAIGDKILKISVQ